MKTIAAASLILISASTFAAPKEYTAAQLRKMVQAGKYPAQVEPPSQSTKMVDFVECKERLRAIAESIQPNYPVKTLINMPAMLSMKMWTNDAAMVMSCSQDNKLVIQNSAYK